MILSTAQNRRSAAEAFSSCSHPASLYQASVFARPCSRARRAPQSPAPRAARGVSQVQAQHSASAIFSREMMPGLPVIRAHASAHSPHRRASRRRYPHHPRLHAHDARGRGGQPAPGNRLLDVPENTFGPRPPARPRGRDQPLRQVSHVNRAEPSLAAAHLERPAPWPSTSGSERRPCRAAHTPPAAARSPHPAGSPAPASRLPAWTSRNATAGAAPFLHSPAGWPIRAGPNRRQRADVHQPRARRPPWPAADSPWRARCRRSTLPAASALVTPARWITVSTPASASCRPAPVSRSPATTSVAPKEAASSDSAAFGLTRHANRHALRAQAVPAHGRR